MSETGDGARTFSPLIVGLMLAVGVFAFAAFFVLSAYAPDLRRGNDGRPHALSKSAVGFAGAVRLLELRSAPVLVSRAGTREQTASLFVATPETTTTGPDREALDEYVNAHEEPILVVLPKWEVEAHPRRPGWVRRSGVLNPDVAVSPMLIFNDMSAKLTRRNGTAPARLSGFGAAQPPVVKGPSAPAAPAALEKRRQVPVQAQPQSIRTGPLQSLQVLTGSGFQPVITDGAGGTVLAYVERRNTYVLSDPDLLNTQGLADLDTARAALALVDQMRAGGGPVVFDVSLHGFGSERSLLKLAFAPPFLAATLCAAAAAGLAGWQAAVRFGPQARSRRPFALGKQALADNAAALIKQSGREHRMARRYAELTQARAAHAVAAPAGDEAATAVYLDGLPRASQEAPRLSALLAEARGVGTREGLLGVARRLHAWRREIAREH